MSKGVKLMNEELLKQLREVLEKNGVEEEKIEATLTELAGADEKEVSVEEVEEEPIEEPVEEVADEMPVEPADDEAVVEEVATEPTEEIVDEPVVEEQPQMYDDSELRNLVSETMGKLDELQKANDGLLARIGALEEALASAGVIDKTLPTANTESVNENAPSVEDLGNPMDNFLARVRSNKRY